MKSRDGKNQTREEKNKEDPKEKVQKIEDAGARKGRKVVKNLMFFE